MRESAIYQEILQEGRQEGETLLVLRLLTRRFGTSPELRSQIQQLSIEQLEELGEALLDFSSIRDLTDWLQNCQMS